MREDFALLFGKLQHGICQQRGEIAALHVAVVVGLAAGQAVDEEKAFHHRGQIAVAHQAAGQPDGLVHLHAVLGGEGGQFGGNAETLADLGEGHVVLAGRDDHGRHAVAGQRAGLAQGLPEGGHVVERRGFEDLHAHGFDDRARVAAGHLGGGAGELDAVAVHDEGDGRLEGMGGVEAVEGMPGDPAGIAAMAEHPGVGPVGGALAERLADRGRDHDAETAAVELRAAGHPRHVAGDVQPAAEGVHDPLAVQIAQHGQRGEIADGGVGVFDGEIAFGAVDDGQRGQQRGNQIEAAAHMVHFVDLGEGGDGFDRQPGGVDLHGLEQGDVVGRQAGDLLDVQRERRDGRDHFAAHVERIGQKPLVAFLLAGCGGELGFHSGGGLCRKRRGASIAGSRLRTA